ncbi:unnamed protein product [Psylliodes chrysocephalus]|uniref:Uncharacterized protein n=1 Tax=Psylliodes chrysocephalus TaxID=3402493 RepID=A0A9P0GN18_9CUCU|nr:unnamed protein product [Psylliodes chrysocephala]
MSARKYPENIAKLDDRTYSQWLLDLGKGTIPNTTLSAKAIIGGSRAPQDLIQIPRTFQLDNIDRLIEFVFDNDFVNRNNGNKAILYPTNTEVAHVSNVILDKLVNIEERTRRNRYIQAYKTIGEVLGEENDGREYNERNIIVGFIKDPVMNVRRREFNLPESRSETAAIFQGTEPPFEVALILYPHNPNTSQPHRRHHELKNLNPMAYPLLLPLGDNGYSTDLY